MKKDIPRPYESEVDLMIRTMRMDPKIEAERQRNWQHWWQQDPLVRDASSPQDEVPAQGMERDMAYVSRRAQPQGGRK